MAKQHVVFLLNEVCFAISVDYVQEILRMQEITPLPNAADYVSGVTNLRGQLVQVIDLHKRLDFERPEKTEEARIIDTLVNGHRVGFVVDAVQQVTALTEEDDLENQQAQELAFVDRVVSIEGELVLVLKPEELFGDQLQELSEEEIAQLQEMRAE